MPTENRSSSNHGTRTFTLDSLTAALEQVQALHEISADLIAENVFGQPAQQGQGEPVWYEHAMRDEKGSPFQFQVTRSREPAFGRPNVDYDSAYSVTVDPLYKHVDHAEVERLRAELKELRESMAYRSSLIGRMEQERDTLRVQLADRGKLLQGVVDTNALLWDDVFSTAESIDLHHRIEANLSASAEPSACAHNWVDARNDHIQSGELCSNCHAVRAGNLTSEPSTPVEIDERAEFVKAVLSIPYLNEGRLATAERFWMARAALANKGSN